MTLNNDTATATTPAAGFRAEKPARSFIAQKSQHCEMEKKGFEDRSALEAKYEKLYEPYYSKRREIVNGMVEVKGVVDGDVAKKEGDKATKGTSEAIPMKSATKMQQKLSTEISEAKPMESVTETQQNHSTGELQNIQAVYKLNGRNYQQWSQLVKTLLKGKGKLSHLNGGGPDPSDPRFDTWDKEDSMIMYWLWNSMQPEIAGTFMLFTTAQEIWEAVRQTYSKMHNAVKIYEIKTKVAATRQGSSSVTEYADILKSFWREMDDYQNIEMKCSEDAITFRRFVERERIFCFLAGLNVEFDQVRVQVLGKEDMPSMNETIAIVQAEESRRVVMLEPQPVEGSTLVSINSGGGGQPGGSKSSKPTIWCNHCKKPWHTVENCWKLHGKPQKTVGKYQDGGFKHWQQQGQTHLTNARTSFQDHTEFIGGKEAEFKRDFEKLGNLLQSIDDYDDPFGMCSLALSESDYDDFTKEDYLYNVYMEDDECFW